MTTIEKIKAEIERKKTIQLKRIQEGDMIDAEPYDKLEAYNELLSFLDTLESEKPMKLDFEQELYKRFGMVKDFTLGMRIAQAFYELGCRRTAEKYDEIEYNRQRAEEKQMNQDGLEKELDRYLHGEFQQTAGGNFNNYIQVARHFAQWGAEHIADVRKMIEPEKKKGRTDCSPQGEVPNGNLATQSYENIPKDLEKELIDWCGKFNPSIREEIQSTAYHFAGWQKEQDDRLVDIIYQQGIEKGKDEIRKTLKRKEKK